MAKSELKTVAVVLAIGLKATWPEASAAAVFAASPPVAVVTVAIGEAMRLAGDFPGRHFGEASS